MKSIKMHIVFVILLLSFSLGLSIFVWSVRGIDDEVRAASNLDETTVFLPQVLNKYNTNTIYGHVTDDGDPAVNISLELWRSSGVTASRLITVTTNLSGDYTFQGIPALGLDQTYWVQYSNITHPTRLWRWYTRELTSFPDGSMVNIGNFDIADVPLVAPSDREKIVVPYNFQWMPRPATPTDSYLVNIYPYAPNQPFSSPPQDTGSYNLSSKPANIQYCNPFFWEVEVRSPDGGYGLSYDYFLSTFHQSALSGIHGCVTEDGVPVHGVEVKLCNWLPGGICESLGTTNTNNGYFSFTGKPSSTGNPYRVIFENPSNPNRLSGFWSIRLYDYTAGSTTFIGDFDIKNISLNLPGNNVVTSLPATFDWDSRTNTQWDDYEFNLFDPSDGDPWFWTVPPLGYDDDYSLEELPPGFSPGTWYAWDVWIWDLWGGIGESYEARWVGFTAPPRVASPGTAPEHVLPDQLQLRDRQRVKVVQTQSRWLLNRGEDRP
jgi:hypothetical protein